jgi:hypothetical protein
MLVAAILITALVSLATGVVALIQLAKLKQRFTTALGDIDHDSLESTLGAHITAVKKVSKRIGELEDEYKRLSATGSLASQKVSIVRFNPFGDTGGDQSFSLAVLDAHDSGYVLTSIHGRQGTRVYVKPIDFAKSKYSLSGEEQQALGQAIKRVPKLD